MSTAFPAFVSTVGVDAATRQRVSRAARRGRLREITTALYTSYLDEPLSVVVRRHAYEIAGLLYPGGVVGYRTALEGSLRTRDALFITHDAASRTLPGLAFRTIPGHGPLPDDMRMGDALYAASVERFLLENLVPSRTRHVIARSVGADGVERFLAHRAILRGEAEWRAIRERAWAIAPALGLVRQARQLDQIISGLQVQGSPPGTEPVAPTVRAQARSEPIDGVRVADFEALTMALNRLATASIPRPSFDQTADAWAYWRHAAFFESYFSNRMEGIAFEVDEARAIVFDAEIPESRRADAHDILGVYNLVEEPWQAMRTPQNTAQFIDQLKHWHRDLFSARPRISPGAFKIRPNRVGDYRFVAPEQVQGTLKAGFEIGRAVRDPVARAIFLHHLISEVHPFEDGNGRLARLFMNAELSRSGLTRVVIPSILSHDYLAAVRLLSRTGDPRSLHRVIETAQRLHDATPMVDYSAAMATLIQAHAFDRPSRSTHLVMRDAEASDTGRSEQGPRSGQ
ncbi:Fic family protein [Salinisphaera sp. RV14]